MGQTSQGPCCNTSQWFFVDLFQRITLCGADVPRTMLWHSLMRGAELSLSFTPGLGTHKLPIRFDTDTCPCVQRDGRKSGTFLHTWLGNADPPHPPWKTGAFLYTWPKNRNPHPSTSFFSRVSFLCWLLFWYPFHPRVTAVAHKRARSFCQKCRWQVTAKRAYTLRVWLCMKWHGVWLYGVHRTCAEMATVSCGTSHPSAVSTPHRWMFKKHAKKKELVTQGM